MHRKSNKYWIISCGAAIILVVVTFTPLVIPYGVYTPMFLGLPYSLWTGILISTGLVVLTLIATRVHPGRESAGKK